MKILLNNNELNKALLNVTNLGFVPTMGSLHKGHISLIKNSIRKCNKTIVSIFVNPTQFNNKKDFDKYPRNYKKDLTILKKMKVNFVYLPSKDQIYSSKRTNEIKIFKKDKILCAKFRKGHFEGVLDVMERLINVIKPKKIFMGEKDFQQMYLVKKFIKKKYKIIVVPCKTIRDSNKLALSSRNNHLTKKELRIAGKLTQKLINFKKELKKLKNLKTPKKILDKKKSELVKTYNIKIEYLELRNINNLKNCYKIKDSRIFISYYLNKIRLIDNF